ncbi:MAG: hypothetical protein J5767_02020 [Paludibacteraceae bacterium]|nr:hypothetical protein [Paludibacteraceae bacterium]
MRKKVLAILAFSGCLLCLNAQKQYMTVEQLDGKMYSFSLDENPIVTYENGSLIVNGSLATSYAISDVKNYHFTEGDETGVNALAADVLQIVSLNETTLQVLNAQALEKVSLVGVNGVTIFVATTDKEGSAVVTLPNQKGVYVLTVGTKSIKVIRK